MKSADLAHLELNIGNILISQRKIVDWNAEASKNLLQPSGPLSSLPTLASQSPAIIELSAPFYVHVANIPFIFSRAEIYYFFGGYDKLFNVFIYKCRNGRLRGDCMLHVKSVQALIHVLKMDRKNVCDRFIRVRYVDSLMGKFRDIAPGQVDSIREKVPTVRPQNFGNRSKGSVSIPTVYRTVSGREKQRGPVQLNPRMNNENRNVNNNNFTMKPKQETHILLRREASPVTIKGSLETETKVRAGFNHSLHLLEPLTNKNSLITENLKPLTFCNKTVIKPDGKKAFGSGWSATGPKQPENFVRNRNASQTPKIIVIEERLRSKPSADRSHDSKEQHVKSPHGSRLCFKPPLPKKSFGIKANTLSSPVSRGDSDNRNATKVRSSGKINRQPKTKSSSLTAPPKTSVSSMTAPKTSPTHTVMDKVKNEKVFLNAKPTTENVNKMSALFDQLVYGEPNKKLLLDNK